MKRHTLVLLAVLVCRAAFADEADDVKTVLDAAAQHDRKASGAGRSSLRTKIIQRDRPFAGPKSATRHEVAANLPVGAMIEVYLGEETMDLVRTLQTLARRARDPNYSPAPSRLPRLRVTRSDPSIPSGEARLRHVQTRHGNPGGRVYLRTTARAKARLRAEPVSWGK